MNRIRNALLFKRLIAYLLCFITFASPFHVIAAEVSQRQAGQQGQSFAEMLLKNMEQPSKSGDTIHFPDANTEINVKDLYPGSSGASDKDESYFYPSANDGNVAQEHFDSGKDLDRLGLGKQETLFSDATGGDKIELGYTTSLDSSPTIQGAAYKIILDRKNASKPDLRNDPAVNSSREIIQDLASDGFTDCKLEQIVSKKQGSIHLPEMERCERIMDYSGTHSLTHEYDLGIIRYISGKPNYRSCGDGCLEIWVGTIGDNYWSGHCKIFEESTEFEILNKDAIKSVVINNAQFDDYFQIYLNQKMVWTHTPGVFPPETPGRCERSTNWNVNPNKDVTQEFKDNEILKFKTRTSVTGNGEGYARIRITFDPKKAFRSKGWFPQESADILEQAAGGYCKSAVVECVAPPGLGVNECYTYMGVKVCPKDIGPAPHPAINPLCQRSEVKLDCSVQSGDIGCWIDAYGEEQCYDNPGDNLNSCNALEKKGCGFVQSKCLHEAPNGACHIYEESWDCGKSVNYDDETIEEEYVCDGPISCMGEECISVNRETSDSFGKVAALLNVVEHADGMLQCGDNPGATEETDLSGCTIFRGEKNECKKAMGGVVDCCEKPKGVSLGDYLVMLQATKKIDSAMLAISETSGFGSGAASQYVTKFREPVQGAYNSIKEPVVDGFKKITSPFVNYAESTGATISQRVTEQVLNTVHEALGESAKQFLTGALEGMGYDSLLQGGVVAGTEEVVGEEAFAQTMGQTVGSIISFVGWVYLAYQVATLVIQMIYKCTKSEMELMVGVQLKKCSYVGSYCASKTLGACTVKKESYCCYDSPLARIVVEQGYKQLGKTQGTAKAPQCNGLTLAEMEKLDWDRIDLSEWTGMLIEHNLYAGTSSLSSDSITGKGSYLPGENGERLNVEDRTAERFKDSHVDDIRIDFQQKMDFKGGQN